MQFEELSEDFDGLDAGGESVEVHGGGAGNVESPKQAEAEEQQADEDQDMIALVQIHNVFQLWRMCCSQITTHWSGRLAKETRIRWQRCSTI